MLMNGNNSSLKNKILSLRRKGNTYNEIANILKCSKSTISFHCRKYELSDFNKFKKPTESEINKFKVLYIEHKSLRKVSKLTGWSKFTIRKYVDISEKKSKISRSEAVINWRKRTKEKLVKYKGGKCERCEYNKCINALEFHHLDPNEKDFQIGGKSWSFERLKKEVDKCILVCSNCHREIHSENKLSDGQVG